MKKIKIIAGRILFIIIMLFAIIAFILYKQGYYDISFITRETESVINENIITLNIESETTMDEQSISELPIDESNPEVLDESNVVQTQSDNESIYKESLSEIENAKSYLNNGWRLTDAVYDENKNKIVVFNLPLDIDNKYSYRNHMVQTQVFNESNNTTGTTETVRKLPLLRSYMGYLIINNADGTNSIYTPAKNIINRNLSNLHPAYIRDTSGNPVFIYDDEYYILDDSSRLTQQNIDTIAIPALQGNYPSYYGRSNMGLYVFYEERVISRIVNASQVEAAQNRGEYIEPIYVDERYRLYGYKNESGSVVIPAKYYYAYNFSDNGLAVVADNKRAISVINVQGTVVANVQGATMYLPEISTRVLYDGYYLPTEFTMEKRGMLYYDHGLLRVRRVITQYNNMGSIIKEYDILLKEDGTIYELPTGYEIVYYSDGVVVLKNDTHYGCFSATGKWIAQPIYKSAKMFNEGLAVLETMDGKKGVIDTSGDIVLPFVFDEISDISGGVITAYEKEHGWSVYLKISKEG